MTSLLHVHYLQVCRGDYHFDPCCFLQIQSHRVLVAARTAEDGLLDGENNNNKDARDSAHHPHNVLKCSFPSFLSDDDEPRH